MNIITDLFYGAVMPSVTPIPEGSDHARQVELQEQIEEKMRTLLDEPTHHLFLDYANAQSCIEGILSQEKFVFGFRVGLLLAVEVLHRPDTMLYRG